MKILLMGGSGWLGHSIACILDKNGYDVTILSRGKKNDFSTEVSSIPSIHADKSDDRAMQELFSVRYTHVIDTVPTAESIGLTLKYAKGLKHYIHCSSTGGYTPLPFIPCDETAPYLGFSKGTGWNQKCEVDQLAISLFQREGFPATVIRPCYITGPGMMPMDNFGGRRANFIRDILEEKTLDLPGDGNALIQPIHIKELARSFLLALEEERSIGQIYNICLAHALTLNRYLELTADEFGRKVHINHMSVDDILKKYSGSINETGLRFLTHHMCFSIGKAARDLNYIPRVTPEEAIAETARWAAGRTFDN